MRLPKKAGQAEVLACEIPRAPKCFRMNPVALEGVSGDAVQRSLSVARGAAATLGTGMKFLDDSTQTRIGLPSIVCVDVVHNLVAVVVHLHPAARANHLVSLGHSCHPCLQRSGQRYLLTTVAQGLRHPDEFFQKLVDTPNVGLVEKSSVLGKHFLNA
jgi:hypothetical protein